MPSNHSSPFSLFGFAYSGLVPLAPALSYWLLHSLSHARYCKDQADTGMHWTRFTDCFKLPVIRAFQCRKGKLESPYQKSLLSDSLRVSVSPWTLAAALWQGSLFLRTVSFPVATLTALTQEITRRAIALFSKTKDQATLLRKENILEKHATPVFSHPTISPLFIH